MSRDRVVAQCFLDKVDIADEIVKSHTACDWPKHGCPTFSNTRHRRSCNGRPRTGGMTLPTPSGDFQNGEFKAQVAPQNDTIAFNDEGGYGNGCHVWMQRIGPWLLVWEQCRMWRLRVDVHRALSPQEVGALTFEGHATPSPGREPQGLRCAGTRNDFQHLPVRRHWPSCCHGSGRHVGRAPCRHDADRTPLGGRHRVACG